MSATGEDKCVFVQLSMTCLSQAFKGQTKPMYQQTCKSNVYITQILHLPRISHV